MSTSLFYLLSAVLLFSGLLMGVLALAYAAPGLRSRRIFGEESRNPTGSRFVARAAATMVLSAVLVFGLVFAVGPWMLDARSSSWMTMLGQGIAILALYDVTYYFMHRYAFHQWGWLKRVHAVHHAVHHPSALDSLYLHPVEAFLGLALLIACTLVIGPVSEATFVGVFAVYSFLNIFIHCGLDLRLWPLAPVSYLARKHDLHHTSWRGGNFASITPVCDLLFGTAE